MKRWRTVDGGCLADAGEGVFHLLTPLGTLERSYEPRDYALEDSYYRMRFQVEGVAFVAVTDVDTQDEPSERRQRNELEGLQPLGEDEAPTAADVQAALERHAAAAQRGEEETRAQIAARAGAAPGGLPQLAGPRSSLAERVVRYSDDVAQRVLGCLDELAALQQRLSDQPEGAALVGAAADELAGAARLVCFAANADDRALATHPGNQGPTPAMPSGPVLQSLVAPRAELAGTPEGALLERLESLAQHLIYAADVQGYVDAHHNEASYLRATTRVVRAAPHLVTACRLARGAS